MRTKILAVLVFAFALSLSAQEVKAPAKVKEAFVKLYPKATDIKWSKEGKDEFEIGFKNENSEISIVLDKEGKLLETETDIEVNQLPASILEFVKTKHPDHKITEAAKIVDSKGVVTYEAEISKGSKKKDLVFDKDGKLVKKDAKEKKEKDEKGEKEDND